MPYAPQTSFRGDIHLAKGLDDVASAIADYTKSRDQAEMMHGYVAQAAQSGLMDPSALADFAKGNLSKKLQLGADAQVAMKHALEMMDQSQRSAGLGMEGARIAEGARQFDASQGQRQKEMEARGQVAVTRRDDIAPGTVIVNNPGTGQTQVLEDTAAGDEWPPQIHVDPATGASFIRRGGKAYPINQKQRSALDDVMAAILAQSAGVAVPQGGTPRAGQPPLTGNPPMPAPSKYEPGKIYRDAKGNRAKYNADGSWSPVP